MKRTCCARCAPSLADCISEWLLKVEIEVSETLDLKQALAGGSNFDGVVFENPGVGVVNVDSVQARGECGVDVGAGTVADHPCGAA